MSYRQALPVGMNAALPATDQTRPRLEAVTDLTDDIGLRFRWERLCELDPEWAKALAFNFEFRLAQELDAAERFHQSNQERSDRLRSLRDGR